MDRHQRHHRLSPVLDSEENDNLHYHHQRRPSNNSGLSKEVPVQQRHSPPAGSRSPASLSDGGDSNLVMDMDPLSPAQTGGGHEWNGSSGSYSSGGEGESDSPSGGGRRHRRPAVVPVEDHLELAEAVLNSAGPRINCPVGEEEDDSADHHRPTTPYPTGGRGMSSTTTSISCN
jgi:hypothetical protein